MTTIRIATQFHSVDPVDRVGYRCDELQCSRVVGHPGPHRSVCGVVDTYWGTSDRWGVAS